MVMNTKATPSTIASPFCEEIQQVLLPVVFKMPTMKTYKGKTDHQDHLDAFNNQMDLLLVTSLASCRCFAARLSGITKKWIG